jgi:transcription elongation factor GreA
MDKKVTAKGLEKLKIELAERISKRDSLRSNIEEMRNRGDLRENDGYTIALDNNETNERRIGELEFLIETSIIVNDADNSTISVGNSVKVAVDENSFVYEIVGDSEADPLSNKISENSPIGKAFVGKRVGDTAVVELPRGIQEYRILEIN